MSTELVQLVTTDNVPAGACERGQMRRENLWHRSTFVFVFAGGGASGEIVVQRRTASKDYCPSFLDLATGGVVQANESYDDNARRELAEELGLHAPSDKASLEWVDTFAHEDERCRVWGGLYVCMWRGRDVATLQLQPEEVESVVLMDAAAIEQCLADGSARVTPDSVHAYRVLRERRPELFEARHAR